MAKRKKVTQRDPFGREQSTYEEENEDALDANGIVKDGHTVRVPMFMRDSVDAWRNEMAAYFAAQDAARGATSDVTTIDPSSPPMVVDAFGGTAGLGRPGARYLAAGHRTVDHAVLTALAVMRDEAYRAYDQEAQNAWRVNARIDATPTRDAVEQAYLDYDREVSEAWRKAR
jgi:hypothetical protein